jgi:hypothetical protein
MSGLTHRDYDVIEGAIRRGTRIIVQHRGGELVLVPLALRADGRREAIAARHPVTGDDLMVFLDEIETVGDLT